MALPVLFVVFVLAIFFHESGHALAARALGIPVVRFEVGFGPRLWERTRGITTYCVRLIPLIGAVHLDPERKLSTFPLWKRFLFVLGGPVGSFLFAALLAVPATQYLLAERSQGVPLWLAALVAIPMTLAGTKMLFIALSSVISQGLAAFAGPTGIFEHTGQALASGPGALSFWLFFLALNVLVLNLLPLPPLDGGHLLFYTIEAVVRRPVPERIQLRIMKVGALAIMFLVLAVAIRDVLGT